MVESVISFNFSFTSNEKGAITGQSALIPSGPTLNITCQLPIAAAPQPNGSTAVSRAVSAASFQSVAPVSEQAIQQHNPASVHGQASTDLLLPAEVVQPAPARSFGSVQTQTDELLAEQIKTLCKPSTDEAMGNMSTPVIPRSASGVQASFQPSLKSASNQTDELPLIGVKSDTGSISTRSDTDKPSLATVLPVELVHQILRQLAYMGHKEALLASLVSYDFAMEFLKLSYEFRAVHWKRLRDFQHKHRQMTSINTVLPALTIKCYSDPLVQQPRKRTDVPRVVTLNSRFPSNQYSERPHFKLEAVIKDIQLKVNSLTFLGIFQKTLKEQLVLTTALTGSVRHLALIEMLSGESDHGSVWTPVFPACETLWIEPFAASCTSCVRQWRFKVPAVKYIYLVIDCTVHFTYATPHVGKLVEILCSLQASWTIPDSARIGVIFLMRETSMEEGVAFRQSCCEEMKKMSLTDENKNSLRRWMIHKSKPLTMMEEELASMTRDEAMKEINKKLMPEWFPQATQ